MAKDKFPTLDATAIAPTRGALHSYARVIGALTTAKRRKRKHWWHASLRPSLNGLATGVVYDPVNFELELDMANSMLTIRSRRSTSSARLVGQPSRELAAFINSALRNLGVDTSQAPGEDKISDTAYPDYSAIDSNRLHRAFGSVAAALEDLRAGTPEETSPIQVWPHHFDLSMIWLPGAKIKGEDPADEESSDKQMNFGFSLGDEGIPEPYLYVTAYPLPSALPDMKMPKGTSWRTGDFDGAVTLYKGLSEMADPHGYLLELWNRLLEAGRTHLVADDEL